MKAKNLAEWSRIVLQRDNYTCRQCGATDDIEAHHIKQKSLYPELALETDNGVTLCPKCHNIVPVVINHPTGGVRWFPGKHKEFWGRRKLIKVGNSRVIIIPYEWLRYYEEKQGIEIQDVIMEFNNNVITITIEEKEENSSSEAEQPPANVRA